VSRPHVQRAIPTTTPAILRVFYVGTNKPEYFKRLPFTVISIVIRLLLIASTKIFAMAATEETMRTTSVPGTELEF
jgi:hypothetical protein